MDFVTYVKSFPVRNFSKGELLFADGEETSVVLIIREGIVKATSSDASGNERLLWIAGRYDVVPTEEALRPITTTRYAYTAFCDGSAYAIDKKEFLKKISSDAGVIYQVAQGLSEHYDDLLGRLNSLQQPDLKTKILFMLHGLCEKFSGADIVQLHEIGLNLTHQDIADMAHATREAVSLELKDLQDEGFINYSRSTFTVYSEKIARKIKAPA